MADFSALQAELEALQDVTESVVAFIDGAADRLDQAVAEAVAANDAADLTAITDFATAFRAQKEALAAAIVATPPEEPPADEEPPV